MEIAAKYMRACPAGFSACQCLTTVQQNNLSLIVQAERYQLLDKLEAYPLKVRLSEQAEILAGLTPQELDLHMDLRPYMQRTPFIVQVTVSILKIGMASRQACE